MRLMFETILNPIIWLMQIFLKFYTSFIPSVGFSILLVSFTFALLLLPFRKLGERIERQISIKMTAANKEVQALKGHLKGEKLFLATEKIYKKHGYHPIQSVGMGASFFVMLPVLISAILLFSGNDILPGESFLFIDDLSKPDGLIGPINVLPFMMSGVTVLDARLRFKNDRTAQLRFFLIAGIMLVLVYNIAPGLILYWTGNNIMSLILGNWRVGGSLTQFYN